MLASPHSAKPCPVACRAYAEQAKQRTAEAPAVPPLPSKGIRRSAFCETSSWDLFPLRSESPSTLRRLIPYFQRRAPNDKREQIESSLFADGGAPLNTSRLRSA